MDSAFDYIKANNGVDIEMYYQYSEREQRCMFDRFNVGAKLTGYVDLTSGDEEALKQAIATQGPVSVIIDASAKSFQVSVEPSAFTQLTYPIIAAIQSGRI